MKRLLPAFGAVAAAWFMAMPTLARIESGTADLLRLVQSKGVTLVHNGEHCSNGISGMFRASTKTLIVCSNPSGVMTANDHDTVRHEVWHYLQMCVTLRRNLQHRGLTTVAQTSDEYRKFVQNGLTPDNISSIRSTYTNPRHHAVELEAFSASRTLTAEQIGTLVYKYC